MALDEQVRVSSGPFSDRQEMLNVATNLLLEAQCDQFVHDELQQLSEWLRELQSLLGALVITPCHVTGEHTPTHHLHNQYVCTLQSKEVLERLLGVLNVRMETLPRSPHSQCRWCDEKMEVQQQWAINGPVPKDA